MKILSFLLIILSFTSMVNSAERFAIPYFPGKDITRENKILNVDDLKVEIQMLRPAKVFHKIKFKFIFTKNGRPFTVKNPFVKFNMKMDMGKYHFKPECNKNICETEIILPKCIWGDDRWFGKLLFNYKSKCESVIFFFDIKD